VQKIKKISRWLKIIILTIFFIGVANHTVSADFVDLSLSYSEKIPNFSGGVWVDYSSEDWIHTQICTIAGPYFPFHVKYFSGTYPDRTTLIDALVYGSCWDNTWTWANRFVDLFGPFPLQHGNTDSFPDGNYWLDFYSHQNNSYYFNFTIANGALVPPVPATCSDGIQNQDETGIDVGGICGDVVPPSCVIDCFSNVLFLPGIKGSILKSNSDTLWPPTIFSVNDVDQLALTNDGESINDIHVDGILDKFYNTSIYSPFSDFMDGLVSEGLIKEWLPLAYDWRFSPEKILEEGIKTANETLDIMEEIEELAENSKTGKITIVSHSMGGFFGKAIIKKLQEKGKDSLIDSFVMVGTPQLGTPQAVASILHGDSEGIAAGFIVNSIGIRRIAQNMPSAYNLLPSSKYFDEVADPVIIFDSIASFTQAWRDFWGPVINIYSSFSSFMTGTGVIRTKPIEQNLQNPEILRPELMADAANFHSEYDDYQFPEHIRIVQVAGWGSPTTKAVKYKIYHGQPSYETEFTVEGDRTVVYSSAVSSVADETYFFNIIDYNKVFNSNTQHRDLLNTNTLQELLKSVIIKEDITNINFLSITKPPVINFNDQLIISTHSPVILGAYDQFGNFTGIDPNQNLSADILSVSENIPGSSFIYTNDSQYIFIPKESAYNFIYKGTGEGFTTVKIDNFSSDINIPIVQYTDIPTTAGVNAQFIVTSSAPEETIIEIDTNGDGNVDETIYEDNYEFSLDELIAQIKGKINSLNVNEKIKRNLIKKIEGLEKKIQRKKERNAKILVNFEKKIIKQEIRGKISMADATQITNLLDLLEAQSDNVALDSGVLAKLKTKITSLNIKQALKKDLLKRVERLENKKALIKNLSNLSKDILKKVRKGKIVNAEAQAIVNIINKIENLI